MEMLFSVLVALCVTFVALIFLNRFAPVIGLMDQPNSRKIHVSATPLTGGLAIAIGAASLIIMAPEVLQQYTWVLLGTAVMLVVGTVDDARNISVYQRLFIQSIAATFAIFGGDTLITTLGTYPIIGQTQLGWLSYPLTYFALLAGVNAFNLIDGLDGLASTLVLIPMGAICWLAHQNGLYELSFLSGVLTACIALFLLFNMRLPWQDKARAFLGDAGSTSLGFLLSCLLIKIACSAEAPLISPVTALWFVAIPMIDTLTVILLRKVRGESAFRASKDHVHHVLTQAGLKVHEAWAFIMLSALGFTVFSLMFNGLFPDSVLLVAFVALAALHVFLALHLLHSPETFKTPQKLKRIKNKIHRNRGHAPTTIGLSKPEPEKVRRIA